MTRGSLFNRGERDRSARKSSGPLDESSSALLSGFSQVCRCCCSLLTRSLLFPSLAEYLVPGIESHLHGRGARDVTR